MADEGACCYGGKNRDSNSTSFSKGEERVRNSQDHKFGIFSKEDEHQEDEEGTNAKTRIRRGGCWVLIKNKKFRWRSGIRRRSKTSNSFAQGKEEDGDLGIGSEEAHFYLQDSGLLKEANKDTKEGKKLPEEIEEEVDSE